MCDATGGASWSESRRLIVAQLTRMDESLRENSHAIQQAVDLMRETTAQLAKDGQTAVADLNLRIALLEQRAKVWGLIIGLLSGAVATGLTQLVVAHLEGRS